MRSSSRDYESTAGALNGLASLSGEFGQRVSPLTHRLSKQQPLRRGGGGEAQEEGSKRLPQMSADLLNDDRPLGQFIQLAQWTIISRALGQVWARSPGQLVWTPTQARRAPRRPLTAHNLCARSPVPIRLTRQFQAKTKTVSQVTKLYFTCIFQASTIRNDQLSQSKPCSRPVPLPLSIREIVRYS